MPHARDEEVKREDKHGGRSNLKKEKKLAEKPPRGIHGFTVWLPTPTSVHLPGSPARLGHAEQPPRALAHREMAAVEGSDPGPHSARGGPMRHGRLAAHRRRASPHRRADPRDAALESFGVAALDSWTSPSPRRTRTRRLSSRSTEAAPTRASRSPSLAPQRRGAERAGQALRRRVLEWEEREPSNGAAGAPCCRTTSASSTASAPRPSST